MAVKWLILLSLLSLGITEISWPTAMNSDYITFVTVAVVVVVDDVVVVTATVLWLINVILC